MKVGETVPGNWNHANSRVELHCAGSKRDHRVGQRKIFIGKSLDVSHHVCLRELHFELVLLQELGSSSNIRWDLFVNSVVIMIEWNFISMIHKSVFLDGVEDFNELVKIV